MAVRLCEFESHLGHSFENAIDAKVSCVFLFPVYLDVAVDILAYFVMPAGVTAAELP